MSTNEQSVLSSATHWLSRVETPVRETILKHWVHYKVDEKQTAEKLVVTNNEQIRLIEKALGEHHAVLVPDFHAAMGRKESVTPATLGTVERQLIGDDDTFLRTHTRFQTLMTRGNFGTVVMEAPGFSKRDDVSEYATRLFGHARFKVTEKPIGGAFRVVMPIYDFKRAVDTLSKPIGYRALPDRSAAERNTLENEYRMMMALDARPPEREMDAMVQDLGLKKALQELTRDYRLMFADNLRDGIYTLPVREEHSVIARGVEALLSSGTFSANDAAFTTRDGVKELHITPSALILLEEALFKGIKGKTAAVASILSPEASHARDRYFAGLRLDDVRQNLVKTQLARMDEPMRKEVSALLNGKDAQALLARNTKEGKPDRLGLEVLSRAVESVAIRHDAKQDAAYDVTAVRHAIARGRAMLHEPAFWRSHENSQLVSHHNAIRTDHDEALADLDALLASQPVSQAGLQLLINEPRFASAIRDTGHFLSIVQDGQGAKNIKGFDNGADQYQQAFHLTRAAIEPKSSEAKAASYHIRSDIGKVGVGEFVGRNLFMGLKPILSSVDLMFKKPMLVGGAVLGIATYSAVVPPKYRIATMLNAFMHHVMESLGINHSHDSKAAEYMKTLERSAIKDGKGTHFKNGMRLGVATTAGTAAAAFIGFNIVEDIVVHLPLAVGGVGVGVVGGATGRRVLEPVANDIGDIAGRFSPEPVRQAFRADKALVKQAANSSWIGRAGHNVRQFGRDIDEFGIVATGHHLIDGTQRNIASLFTHVMGNAPEKTPAR